MITIDKIAKYYQNKFHGTMVLHNTITVTNKFIDDSFIFYPILLLDFKNGIKTRAIAIENLNQNKLEYLKLKISDFFMDLGSAAYIKMSNIHDPLINSIDTNQMAFAPTLYVYTNRLSTVTDKDIKRDLGNFQLLINIEEEAKMYKSLFISYGGPDEKIVTRINQDLKSHGIKTWFFPDDAKPGEKLHRMMSNGIRQHDKVLLICSKSSLSRNGVLNEIERILEKEAKEGGSEILIPITLDEFVYGDWAPKNVDIAEQLRSRVISRIDVSNQDKYNVAIHKVIESLKT
ncbi:MAG: toll/interleukin-1 receptor domain-containing protein [Neisseriales bacterium]|nr:MAG: toll/interleukin-1 receptor domain-containing protein [Neisseriales bacterium]